MNPNNEQFQKFLRLGFVLLLTSLFIAIFTPFSLPILLAAFVAFGCEPLINKIRYKTKRRKLFSITLISGLLIVLIAPLVLFTLRIAAALKSLSSESMQQSQFFQALFTLWEKVQMYFSGSINSMGLNLDIIPQKEELFSRVTPVILDKATLFIAALPDLALSIFVFCCMLFVFIMNASELKSYAIKSNILPADEIIELIKTMQSSCYIILISTLLIGTLQGLIVAVGSAIFGFHEFFLIFTITFFLSFVPIIGAAPVAIFLALISFLLGANGNGVGLLVVALIAGSIDNILKPFIFSRGEDDFNPVLSLLGIIGAIILFGLPGLLLGPLILQVSVKLIPTLIHRLYKPTANLVDEGAPEDLKLKY